MYLLSDCRIVDFGVHMEAEVLPGFGPKTCFCDAEGSILEAVLGHFGTHGSLWTHLGDMVGPRLSIGRILMPSCASCWGPLSALCGAQEALAVILWTVFWRMILKPRFRVDLGPQMCQHGS